MYLLAWISSRLGWKFEKTSASSLHFEFENSDALIRSESWEKLGSGTVIAVHLYTIDGYLFEAARTPEEYHRIKIQISSPDQCDLPYRFILRQTAMGQSLVKEVGTKGTSIHYLEMLQELTILNRDRIC